MLHAILLPFVSGVLACAGVVTLYRDCRRCTVAEVIRITPGANPAPTREPLFYLGDEEHTMLTNPPPSLTLAYMDMVKDRGVDAAVAMCCQRLLGEKSYRALLSSDDISDEQLGKIFEIVMDTVLGRVNRPDGPKAGGNSAPPKSSGSRKSPPK